MPPDTSKSAPTPSDAGSAARDIEAVGDLATRLKRGFDAAFASGAAKHSHVVLAVSGGSDSMALMHLAADWRAQRLAASSSAPTPTLSVVTVDHALREGSALEADLVAAAAVRLGLPHTTLVWDAAKPAHGIQAAARQARYALIARHLADHGWDAVATAHTIGDQAETLLMRLARGSGMDGLSAMRPVSHSVDGAIVLRPLLDIEKADLVAYLLHLGVTWSEDPSNRSLDFERIRVRQAIAALQASDFTLTHKALARTATRAARASEALDRYTRDAWTNSGGQARFTAVGYAIVDWAWLIDQPEDIRLRLLTRLVDAIGGQSEPVSQGQLERLTVERGWNGPPAATLHGTQWDHDRPGQLRITRESGRAPLAEITSLPGSTVTWDRRFTLAHHRGARAVQIGPLGPEGLAALTAVGVRRPDAPSRALWALPAARLDGALVAVPALDFAAPGFADALICEPIMPQFGPIPSRLTLARNDGQPNMTSL